MDSCLSPGSTHLLTITDQLEHTAWCDVQPDPLCARAFLTGLIGFGDAGQRRRYPILLARQASQRGRRPLRVAQRRLAKHRSDSVSADTHLELFVSLTELRLGTMTRIGRRTAMSVPSLPPIPKLPSSQDGPRSSMADGLNAEGRS